ncbi:MAG: Fe-S-cluster oxidoreductase [Betaproteobacteria bacterium]|nr:Fe-S-cluster oxidoreductase [Betaproteobacteria bacterium]
MQLDAQLRCKLFGQPERPAVCRSLKPSAEMCGSDRDQALRWLSRLDDLTRPIIT